MFEGAQPGPSIAVFAGVHGDERVGINALRAILPQLSITKGTLYVVFANPPAIEAGTRMLTKNLNRCFYKNNDGHTPEDQRARELMEILDNCEALLDLHASDDTSGGPFVICEENAFDIAKRLNVPIVSTNWTEAEPGGTDAYMYLNNKIGLCVECGYITDSDSFLDLAIASVWQFLKYFDLCDTDVAFSTEPKRHIKATRGFIRTSEAFTLDTTLHSFDALTLGNTYGSHDGVPFIAGKDECIIFPRPQAPLNTEAFVIGRELDPIK